MNEVTKKEFEEFISNYDKKLVIDICAFFDPPLRTWNDFSLGDWPKSVVAAEHMNCEKYLINR